MSGQLAVMNVSNDRFNECCKSADVKRLEVLVEQGADINGPTSDGEFPIITATIFNCLPTVQYLIACKVNVNVSNRTCTKL